MYINILLLKYEDHLRILIENLCSEKTFSMPVAKEGNIEKILMILKPKKASSCDAVPIIIVNKLSTEKIS